MMKKILKRNLLFVILMVAGLSLTVIGCGDDNGHSPKGPEIVSLTANPASVEVNQTATLTCTATHPEGFPLEYIWETTGGSVSGSGGSSVTWIAPGSAGQYIVICKVIDSNGKQDTANVTIQVTDAGPTPDDMVIALSWSTSGDMDLRMNEPDGSQTTQSSNGTTGRHSGDLQTGTGPETITVEEAMDGIYGIEIHSFGQNQTARLEINLSGVVTTYTCQVSAGSGGQVASVVFPDGRVSLVQSFPAGITCM